MKDSNIWVNGGYFVLSKEVFRYFKPGEELVYEPMQRMIAEGKVWSRRYEGFWQCMDTFKDKQILDELEASGVGAMVRVEEWQACTARVDRMIGLELRARSQEPFVSSCAWERTPTTLRSVAAQHCCNVPNAPSNRRFTGWSSVPMGSAATEATKAAEQFTAGCESEVVLKGFRDGYLPYERRQGEGLL